MPHYSIKYLDPDGEPSEVSMQTSDPDAAVSVFKLQFPDCDLQSIEVGPDMCVITNCAGSRSVLLQTPFVHLNIPNGWSLAESAALIAYFDANDVKTHEEGCTCGQMVVEYNDNVKSLLAPLMDAVKARL